MHSSSFPGFSKVKHENSAAWVLRFSRVCTVLFCYSAAKEILVTCRQSPFSHFHVSPWKTIVFTSQPLQHLSVHLTLFSLPTGPGGGCPLYSSLANLPSISFSRPLSRSEFCWSPLPSQPYIGCYPAWHSLQLCPAVFVTLISIILGWGSSLDTLVVS